VHEDGKEWVGFPAKSYTGQNGVAHWVPLIEFAEGAKRTREEFRKQAIEAIHAVANAEAA
jgi:hypothetical protein